jgi:hypothetical protein
MQTEYKPFGEMDSPQSQIETSKAVNVAEPKSLIHSLFEWSPLYRFVYPATSQPSQEVTSWFKWYYILPMLFVFFYVLILAESIADSRRTNIDKTVESHEKFTTIDDEDDPKTKGIRTKMINMERHHDVKTRMETYTKHIKSIFGSDPLYIQLSAIAFGGIRTVWSAIEILYEWWIRPWIYSGVRTSGLRQ